MFAIEREEKIINLIKDRKRMKVDELARLLNVSEVTIRKDLNVLENKGLIVRTFGGAVYKKTISSEIPYTNRKTKNIETKADIAKLAKNYIEDGTSIFLDAGTTTFELCKYMKDFKDLVIFTNDILIANYLFQDNSENNRVFMLGGEISNRSGSCSDAHTIEALKNIKINISFIGCDAIDENSLDLYTISSNKALLKETEVKVSNKSILVSDSKKCDKISLFKFSNCKDFDKIITDDYNKKFIKHLNDNKVNMLTI